MLLFRYQFYNARELFFVALFLVMSSLLVACGYAPLYDQRLSTGLTVKKHLELIQIQPIKDRAGQHLRNNLLVRINPKGKPASPLYTLNVNLEESSTNLGAKKSAVVTRGNLRISATFTLSKVANLTTGIKTKKNGDPNWVSASLMPPFLVASILYVRHCNFRTICSVSI